MQHISTLALANWTGPLKIFHGRLLFDSINQTPRAAIFPRTTMILTPTLITLHHADFTTEWVTP
jgi:hypothetical protein